MSKVTKNERISTLEDAVAMNWSDMKKIETKISRAMTDMATRISNISLQLEGQQRQIHLAADSIGLNKQAIIMFENKAEPKPQLKQLDQSVFNGLDEKWRFAAVDKNGEVWLSTHKTQPSVSGAHLSPEPKADSKHIKGAYDTTDWQNSLIEREDIAKELLEVDLSSELTGSDYYYSKSVTERLENGQKLAMCFVSNVSESDAMDERHIQVIVSVDTEFNDADGYGWQYAVPINNQGEPLTQAEAGL